MFEYFLTNDDGVKADRVGEQRPAFPVRYRGAGQVEVIVFLSPTDAHGEPFFFRTVDAPSFPATPEPAI